MPTWTIPILILGGLFSIAGGLFGWEWFMANRRAAIFVRILGMTGARTFYVLLGLFVAAIGIGGALGLLE
jgi:small neutral amino acid transporter SnatA (MarC family)